MLLSVLIPVYNEESTIGEVIDRVAAVPIEKEIIVVDDGSTDRTAEILKSRAAVLKHAHDSRVNLGKGLAVRIGLTYAEGEIVIIQDADLELDPAEYARLIEPILDRRADAVFGTRFSSLGRPRGAVRLPLRALLANRLITGAADVLYATRLSDVLTAYKVVRRDVLTGIRLDARGFEFETEIVAKILRLGHRIVEVPISYRPRTTQEGKKIRWHHAVPMLFALIRYRFAARKDLLKTATPHLRAG